MRGHRSSLLAAIIIVSVALAACADEPRPLELVAVPLETIGIEQILGSQTILESQAGGASALDLIFAAEFMRGGGVAVLNRSPPFLREFSPEGRVVRTGLEQGPGPAEARLPTSLAVDEDGWLAVLDGHRLTIFGPDREVRGVVRGLPQDPRGVTAGCGNSWLILAPVLKLFVSSNSHSDTAKPKPSLFRVPRAGGALNVVAGLASARPNNFDHPAFLDRAAGGIAIYSEELRDPRLLWVDCRARAVSTRAHLTLGETPRMVRMEEQPNGANAYWDRGTEPYPAGVVALEGNLIWAVNRRDREDNPRTVLTIAGDSTARRVVVEGWYMLHDADRRYGFLLSRDDPYPRVFVVGVQGMMEALGMGADK